MLGKSKTQDQKDLFKPLLKEFIDPEHELVLLGNKIDWKHFENGFSELYSHTGQPSMPIRFMVGCLMLKRLYNLGDETLAKAWIMNPYMQYFTGEAHFQHQFPCDPSDFVHFRKRIGEKGAEMIFAYSVQLHGKKAFDALVMSDTTVQENNVTYPTDAKNAIKIIENCNKIARKEGVKQRQSYMKTAKQLNRESQNPTHPKRRKTAKKAAKKLKHRAGRVVRELERILPDQVLDTYQDQLDMYTYQLAQSRKSKDKIYSFHKPQTACIAKGKAHKKFEFGNKAGVMVGTKSKIVLAVKVFMGNPNDGKTIEPLLNQMQSNFNYQPEEVLYDRAGRGVNAIGDVKVSIPKRPKKSDTEYEKRKARKKFRMRAGIEPIIGHLKSDHRMDENYLVIAKASSINAFLACAGWNLKKMMTQLKEAVKQLFIFLFQNQLPFAFLPRNLAS